MGEVDTKIGGYPTPLETMTIPERRQWRQYC